MNPFNNGLVAMISTTVSLISHAPAPTSATATSIVTIWRIGWLKRVVLSDGDQVSAVLDHLTGQIEVLQTLFATSEANKAGLDEGLAQLTAAVEKLARKVAAEGGQTAVLTKIAEGQERLILALSGPDSPAATDAENRMRLRSIDVQLLRILEEMSAGRQESTADLRGDISALTASVRALARGPAGRG